MPNPKINISSLDFDSIKTSLKTYLSGLKNADGSLKFAGYDFEGSGIDLLLDVMSYNTLYYSFYSNMIANETFLDTAQLENNIVSLVKPLGYLVAGKSCAKSDITAKSGSPTYTVKAYTDFFYGLNSNSLNYNFYTIEDVSLTSGVASAFTVYEGKRVIKDLPVSVDTVEQKAFLGVTDIDLNTLTVKVNGTSWNRYDNYQPIPGPDNTVYFVDRNSNGFYLVFGKKTLNDYQSTFGKTISENDIVTVSYLIPSGTAANGIAVLNNASVTILSNTISASGTDSVDLDTVKFFAPKMFAANDRAVTKDDFYGLLLSANILPANISSTNQINVWGGEEAQVPAFGRVFVSYSDTTLTSNDAQVKKSIAYLKNKCVVTVLPEYVQSQPITVNANISIFGNPTAIDLIGIQNLLETTYNTNTFNNYISLSDIKSLILSKYSSVRNVNITKATLILNIVGSSGSKVVYYKNELNPATTTNTITSDIFTYKNKTVKLINKPNDTTNSLIAQDTSTSVLDGEVVGFIDYDKGIITVNSGVIPTGIEIGLAAETLYTDMIDIKEELVSTILPVISQG